MTIIVLVLLSIKVSYATDPFYSLNVKNIINIDPSTIQFEIFLKNTNPGSNVLKYISGQYVFYFDTLFANSGTMTYGIAPGSHAEISDLPISYLPKAFLVRGNELLMSASPISSDTSKPVISSTGDGSKIIRMRLHTTANAFSGEPKLKWKTNENKSNTSGLIILVNNTPQLSIDSNSYFIESSQTSVNITLAIEGLYNPNNSYLNRKESVTAYLRNDNSSYALVDSAASVIDSLTLTGHFSFANVNSGTSYFIEMKHKNSIGTWSANPVTINGDSATYNFTTAITKAFGNNMILKSNKWCIYSGDINQNGSIDLTDVLDVFNTATNFITGNVVQDLTGDGVVDLTDLILVFNNAKSFVQVIQP